MKLNCLLVQFFFINLSIFTELIIIIIYLLHIQNFKQLFNQLIFV